MWRETQEILVPTRVEPRSYLANERTLVEWLELSATITTVATLLTSTATSYAMEATGLLLLCPAALFALHALRSFYQRGQNLDVRSSSSFSDPAASFFLVILIVPLVLARCAFALWRSGPGDGAFEDYPIE